MKSESQNNQLTHAEPAWLTQAKAQGLLPPDVELEEDASRPWPVVLLTAFGAWLAGLPLLGILALTVGEYLTRSPGSFLVLGLLFVAASIAVLRAKDLPLFLEQFAVPGLWAGVAAMAWGFSQYLPTLVWASLIGLLLLAIALLLPDATRAWLRLLLGASSMVLMLYGLTTGSYQYSAGSTNRWTSLLSPWLAIHLLAAAWMLWHLRGQYVMHRAINLPAFASGWVVAVLAALAWTSGRSFLIGGTSDFNAAAFDHKQQWGEVSFWLASGWHSVVSAALVVLSTWGLATWFAHLSKGDLAHAPLHASKASFGVAVVLTLLAWLMPNLGAALLIATVALRAQRYTLAVFAMLVTAWIIGGFYYQLAWSLALKAVVLVCAGAVLAVLAAWANRLRQSAAASNLAKATLTLRSRWRPILLLATAVTTLGVANIAIWQKEQLIADGKPVFVRLAPRDPRSLMQGDYMALNFALPANLRERTQTLSLAGAQRPFAVGKLTANGELSLTRIVLVGEPIAADEIKIELSPKDGNWTVVTDAWFFKEGDAGRWEQARFGEFRVMPNGSALLVGMADEKLKSIKP